MENVIKGYFLRVKDCVRQYPANRLAMMLKVFVVRILSIFIMGAVTVIGNTYGRYGDSTIAMRKTESRMYRKSSLPDLLFMN
jgi:hypothetical protein